MTKHDILNYASTAVLAGALAVPALVPRISSLDLAGISPQPVNLYCLDSQFPRCRELKGAMKKAGWQVKLDQALSANPGIGVEGSEEFAKRIGKAFGVEAKVTPPKGTWTIWVGQPED